MPVPGMYSEEGRGGSSWLSHCGGHLRQAEALEAGGSSTGDLKVWGNSGSLGSVPTVGAAKVPSQASSEASSLTLGLACFRDGSSRWH